MKPLIVLLMILLLMPTGCDDDAKTGSDPEQTDDDKPGDDDSADDDDSTTKPSNRALVFPINPIATPDPIEVELAWVADDAGGTLTSAEDEDGYRLLRVYSCVDEGETNNAPGIGEQRICTLVQRANKEENGNFVHTDWDNAMDGVYDDGDLHAEVSLYYHAWKMYGFLVDERVGLFDRLPGRHDVGDEKHPLNLVANYRYPSTGDSLMPISMSFYMPHEHMEMGMATFMGVEGIPGDFMLFGQGRQADFAYDGETVYHEFGHMINRAMAGMDYNIYVDDYGMCNLANALEQGLAETFTFLVSGKSALFDYIDQVTPGGGFARNADNEDRFPEDVEGIDQFDGMIVAGANWEAWRMLKEEYGLDAYEFAGIVLRAEADMNDGDPNYTFVRYAESFLNVLSEEKDSAVANDVMEIFEGRGLYKTERVKEPADCRRLYFGGAYSASWNDRVRLQEGDETVDAATAYVQCRFDVPAGQTSLTLSGTVMELPDFMGMYPAPDDWDLKLFIRRGQAIQYQEVEPGTYEAARDETVESDSTSKGEVSWTLEGLTPGERVYLHLVNFGDSPGVAASIEFSEAPDRAD